MDVKYGVNYLFQKKKINMYLLIFGFLIWPILNVRCQCENELVRVSRCPQSAYEWSIKAKEFCVNPEHYHCLITETYNVNNVDIVQCCMKPHSITKGHMPRYSRSKGTIQEIECIGEYYMPIQYPSNKYRENDVENCMYRKFACNMSGMKVCSNGSKVADRKCYCDYRNLYVPEYSLIENNPCFEKDDNECIPRITCNKSNHELNMYYECVKVCPDGYYRPEMHHECRLIVPSMTTTITIDVPVQTTPFKSSISPEDVKNATVNSYKSSSNKILSIILVVGGVMIGLVVTLFFIFKSLKDTPKLIVADNYVSLKSEGKVCVVTCTLRKGSRLFQVTDKKWYRRKMEKNASVEVLPVGNDSKYELAGPDDPSLLINFVKKEDIALYRCVLFYKLRYWSSRKIFSVSTNYVTVDFDNTVHGVHYNINDAREIIMGDKNTSIQMSNEADNEDTTSSKFSENEALVSGVETIVLEKKVYNVMNGSKLHIVVDKESKYGNITEVNWYTYEDSNNPIIRKINLSDRNKYNGGSPNDPSLIIYQVTEENEGFYFCELKLGEKKNIKSTSTYLMINDKTTESKIQSNTYNNYTIIYRSKQTNVGVQNTLKIEESDDDSTISNTSHETGEDDNGNSIREKAGDVKDTQLELEDIHVNTEKKIELDQQQPSSANQNSSIFSIDEHANIHGYDVKNVDGDGNCLFHAASEQMGSLLSNDTPNERAKTLRQEIVQFLKNNPDTPQGEPYEKWLDNESWEQFLDRMSRDKEYGNEIIVKALCHCYNINVKVLSTLSPKKVTEYNTTQKARKTIWLGHSHETQHYVILVHRGSNNADLTV